jgi:tetratricopeptide (TPR) repeat protein
LKKPYSLYRAADFFRQQKKPHAALFLLEKAKFNLEEGEAKQLVELSTAYLLNQIGKKDMALERLKFLSEQEPVTDAGLRARLALLEDAMAGDRFFDFGRMAEEYAVAAGQARDRDFRETTAFKSALAWYFAGHKERSVASFDAFLKNYSAGSLVGEAKAFLGEILPPLIEDMVKQGRDFDAVLMLDKHREILLSHKKDSTFLMNLASSMERLGLLNRAAKIYLFLLDYYRDKEREKFFYLPLVRTYMERREFDAAADFAGRYLQKFPRGKDRQELFYYQVLALHKVARLEDAIAAWEEHQRFAGRKVRIAAARVFWEKERYRDVVACLESGMAEGDKLPPEILVLKAEACFRTGQHEKAYALFKDLAATEKYAQHSLYRCAEIALAAGRRNEALNYLRQVVEKGKEGIWHDFARTLMMEMRI